MKEIKTNFAALTSDSLEKASIEATVSAYIRQFPDEYRIVCDAIKGKRKLTHDEFASVESTKEKYVERGLYEIPETLSIALILELNDGAITFLKTKQGGRWFARRYPEFALPDYGKV